MTTVRERRMTEKVSRREALIRLGIVAGGAVAYTALNKQVWADGLRIRSTILTAR